MPIAQVQPAQQVFAARDWSRDLLQVSFDACKFLPKNYFYQIC